jgi:opacity protein-like surface antigen
MKNFSNKALVTICAIGLSFNAFAGNKDRSGQAGAPEMLINPWARTTGVFGMNTATVSGMEAMKCNIAGMALTNGTDIGVSHGIYLSGTDISINNVGVSQSLGDVGVIGVNIMSMSFGDIPVTTWSDPEGTGIYHPSFLNVQLGYAKQFSSHTTAGVAATYVSEQINNISALGLAFEAGIQYVTGKRDNMHFGITLRNMGTNMRFTGTGFSINADKPEQSASFAVTARQPSEKFEIPTYLNIGAAYDFYLDENRCPKDSMPMQKLTIFGNFTSNSFNNDYLGLGAEYGFRDMFFLRAAYRYEKGIMDPGTSTTMYNGLAVGATVQTRLGAGCNAPKVAFDYSFRPTVRPANGVHMFSLRFSR